MISFNIFIFMSKDRQTRLELNIQAKSEINEGKTQRNNFHKYVIDMFRVGINEFANHCR